LVGDSLGAHTADIHVSPDGRFVYGSNRFVDAEGKGSAAAPEGARAWGLRCHSLAPHHVFITTGSHGANCDS
jgi:hypothetical protein